MKRFKIKNKVNGMEFQVERETIGELQPEWGKPAWTETIIIPAVLDDEGNEVSPESVELVEHPAEYEITEEDISAEIEAKKQKEQERDTARKEIEALEKKQTWTTAELTKAVKLLLAK